MRDITLDLMELSEVGAQPRKLAIEIHRQLREKYGKLVLPIPLREIAIAVGIDEIVERPTTTFEGMLLTNPEKTRGKVILREGMQSGRRNFTLGHEICHFINPYHRPPPDGFQCAKSGMLLRRGNGNAWNDRTPFERMEIEANEFSFALLVPVPEFRAERSRLHGCDLRHIGPLARLFGTSKEVMARIYVDIAPEKIGIFISRDLHLTSFILPAGFPYLGLAKGRPLPQRSVSASFLRRSLAGEATDLRAVVPDVWIDNSSKKVELFEQTLAQRDGWAMTLLVLEESDEDELDEEKDIER